MSGAPVVQESRPTSMCHRAIRQKLMCINSSRMLSASPSLPAAGRKKPSILLRHETLAAQRGVVIIFVLNHSLGQIDGRSLGLSVWNGGKNMGDAVQPAPSLVVGVHDVPRRVLAVRALQHEVARPRIFV